MHSQFALTESIKWGKLIAIKLRWFLWKHPPGFPGGCFVEVCSAVSYFSTLLGSIIGAGWLSFRVRDGSGRFPAAMAAVTLFRCVFFSSGVVFGGGGVVFFAWLCGCECVCKFSAG